MGNCSNINSKHIVDNDGDCEETETLGETSLRSLFNVQGELDKSTRIPLEFIILHRHFH